MNPMSLYLLGRRLMQMAETALPAGKSNSSARLIFVDVTYHPNSSISEITERTDLTQSLVSTAVARLRAIGLLETSPDPLDRRRTLVRTTPMIETVRGRLEPIVIDDVIARELGDHASELMEVMAALDLLSRHLIPEVTSGNAEVTAALQPTLAQS
jgi:DNA-binding MarR family transcriptional regulator